MASFPHNRLWCESSACDWEEWLKFKSIFAFSDCLYSGKICLFLDSNTQQWLLEFAISLSLSVYLSFVSFLSFCPEMLCIFKTIKHIPQILITVKHKVFSSLLLHEKNMAAFGYTVFHSFKLTQLNWKKWENNISSVIKKRVYYSNENHH